MTARHALARAARGPARLLSFAVALVLVAVALLASRPARAQNVEVTASVENDVVEIGTTFSYTQKAMVHGGGAPTDPKPGGLAGFSQIAVSSAPIQVRRILSNGTMEDIRGLVTTWVLRGDRLGSFVLGPSQVTIDGTRRTAAPVRITVAPHGRVPSTARPSSRPSFDPFGASSLDPFKGLFDFGPDEPREQLQPNVDPKLAMDSARAPVAFLHATVDKTQAVVGEQLTLSVYLYEDPYAQQGRPGDVHEATANDFVKRSLLEDESRAVGVGNAMVGGKIWTVKLVRKNALFPLKTGRLTIEPMSMTVMQARVGLRASETLTVDVGEPPLAGRPAGYAIGDVGEMSLQATVTPRATTREGAIGVVIELRGTGNLPGQLNVPAVPGVEWLEPQVREKLGAMHGDRFGGTRTFSYVVRLHKEGALDLGEVRLPHYDPAKHAYQVARATLGIVNVAKGSAQDAGEPEAPQILADMPKARRVLEGPRHESYVSDRAVFWALLFGSPLACVLVLGAQGIVSRVRERHAHAAPSNDRLAKTRRAEAEASLDGDDGKAAMGAVAKAIEAELLAETLVNIRGAAAGDATRELEDAGMSPDDARQIIALTRACEDARFSPDGAAVEAARDTWRNARDVLDRLRTHRGRVA